MLALAAVAISAFTIHRRLDPFDEGLMLQAARRIGEGQWPYADFAWSYGPAQPLLLAGLAKLFGPSVLWWRLLRVATDAVVSLLAFVLARRAAPLPLALVAWLAAATAMAQPASANPFPQALALALGALVVVGGRGARRVPLAGALAGLATLWRPDFGVLAMAAVAASTACEEGLRGARARRTAVVLAVAVGLALVLYAPFAVRAGPGTIWDRIVATSARDAAWWSLPFPLRFHGDLVSARGLKHALGFYMPLLGVLGLVVAAVAAAVQGRVALRRCAGLLVLAAGTAWYLRSRPDEFHTQPLVVTVAVLLAAVVAAWPRRRALVAAAAVLLALLTIDGVANRGSALLRPPALERVGIAVTDDVAAPPGEARSLRALVGYVQARVAPGEPIYVAPRRSDQVAFVDPLLYVLVDRDDPVDQDAPLLSRAPEQRRAIAALERVRPRLVVRWTDPLSSRPEPNLRGRSTGVRLLDNYLARAYRPVARFGVYLVLQRVTERGGRTG